MPLCRLYEIFQSEAECFKGLEYMELGLSDPPHMMLSLIFQNFIYFL